VKTLPFMVVALATLSALKTNVAMKWSATRSATSSLRWGQQALDNFRVVHRNGNLPLK